MKKKIGLLFMIAMLCLFVVGCSDNANENDNNDVIENDNNDISISINTDDNDDIPFFSTEEELFEIETPYCNLYYPIMWNEQILIEFEEDTVYTVKFSAKLDSKSISLFDLCFGGENGDKIGELTVEDEIIDIKMISYGFELDGYTEDMRNDICGMNEDVNVIISKLIEMYDFELVNEEQ